MVGRDRAHCSARTGPLSDVTVDRRHFLHFTGLAFGGVMVLASCGRVGGRTAGPTEPVPPASATPDAPPRVSRNYSYATVEYPKSVKTTLYGINNKGETAGYFADGKGVHGFLRSVGGEFSDAVDHPEAGNATALLGLNDTGDVVGYYHGKSGQGGYPGSISLPSRGVFSFVYSLGAKKFEPIAPPEDGIGTVVAFGINDSGLVSGWYFAQDTSGRSEAIVKGFVWSKAARGYVDTFRYGDEAGEGTFATGINGAGLVVGQFVGKDKARHAFVRDSKRRLVISSVDHPNAREPEGGTCAMAISDSGVVAGIYQDRQGGRAYLRADQDTFVELRHPDAASDMSACGINASGKVVGDFYDSRGTTLGYLATPA
ncbi:hypothetical protein FNH05_25140 [Amycolatopsis rhizosphaerae]|uniref:Uncharacterized protein n=1 Tax=Amycolatopsis rhizosphaerae TaxID=2053003 RepID=A0A558BKP6_9PSEU|nr:hypothetical protein [Amycolatopsis rhizosphaerae]TVT37085.1 hypothetical protein FNH05_25140 [Amycolatopsis rhizosphaerae]